MNKSTLPDGNSLEVTFHQKRCRVQIRRKEGQHDVDEKHEVDDIVNDQQGASRMFYEPELKQPHPRRVEHRKHQPILPIPVVLVVGANHVFALDDVILALVGFESRHYGTSVCMAEDAGRGSPAQVVVLHKPHYHQYSVRHPSHHNSPTPGGKSFTSLWTLCSTSKEQKFTKLSQRIIPPILCPNLQNHGKIHHQKELSQAQRAGNAAP